MTKMFASWIVLVALAGAALAQTPPAEPAPPAPAAAPAPPPDNRKACTDAMNADPKFAAEIVRVADEAAALKRDADTVAAHVDAVSHVQKNERHVIYAYAAMWIIAAGFVIFLWRRQQALVVEIAHLRRDLEAAGAEAEAKAKARP
jgi:hypothetical protein